MIYLVAIFLPPLALLIYGKIFQAIFNLLICLFAFVSIIFAILPIITMGLFMVIWGIAVLHAVLAVNSAKQDARAREVADAMRGRRLIRPRSDGATADASGSIERRVLLATTMAALVYSAIAPHDRMTWAMEVYGWRSRCPS